MLYTRTSPSAVDAIPGAAARSIFYSQWAYWCTLVMALWSVAYLPDSEVRTLLIVTPVLPALLVIAVARWIYQASDEYLRARIQRSIVITVLVLSLLTPGYFLLELMGFPKISMLWINLAGWSLFNVQMLYIVLRSR